MVRFDAESGAWLERPIGGAPPSPMPSSPLWLEAERDEVVSFVLRVSGPQAPLEFRWSEEGGPDGHPTPVQIQGFEARPVHVQSPSHGAYIHSLGPGLYPDALVPVERFTPPPAPGVTSIFVDVFVPAEARPGAHRLSILVGSRRLPLVVDVGAALLPAEDVSGLGAVSFGSFQARLEKSPDAFRRGLQLLYAHRFNVELIPPWRPRVTPEGGPDWPSWADQVAPYLDGSAFSAEAGYRGPRPGQPLTRFVVPVTEKWPSPPSGGRPR